MPLRKQCCENSAQIPPFPLIGLVWQASLHGKNISTFAEVTRMLLVKYLYENNKKGSLGENGPKRGRFLLQALQTGPLWSGNGPLKPSMFADHA